LIVGCNKYIIQSTIDFYQSCNIIVDEEILDEVHLKLVNNIGVDTVKMREIKMQEKIKLK
jgi:hypothetical protein